MKKVLTYSEVEATKQFVDGLSDVISDSVADDSDKDGEIFLSAQTIDIAVVYLEKMLSLIDENGKLYIARVKDDVSYYTAETEEDKTGVETVSFKGKLNNTTEDEILSAYNTIMKKVNSGEVDAIDVKKCGYRSINRAKRIAKLLEIGASEKIVKIEKCMLIEAVAFYLFGIGDGLIAID